MKKGFMARLRAMFGIRSEAERKREEEMEYRMKLREVENKTRMMKQETEKRKQQAIQLEKNGEHQKAVAMALKAENGRKAYVRAENDTNLARDVHETAKIQRTVTEISDACGELTDLILKTADMDGAIRAQSESEEKRILLEETQEQMKMLAEGYPEGVDEDVRNAEGEAALAAFMAEAEGDSEKKEPVPLPEVREKAPEADMGWKVRQRELLQALQADA